MTQTARKGKLYQLQYLIDLSCFIISHILVFGGPIPLDSTKLIYSPTQPTKGIVPLFGPLIAVFADRIGTIIVLLIVARVWPEMGRLKTLNALQLVQKPV
jgi:hypothetical protein